MKLTCDRRRFLTLLAAGTAAPIASKFAYASTPLTMQAAWINDAEFAGYFLAIDKGYYSDEGLDLNYQEGYFVFPYDFILWNRKI